MKREEVEALLVHAEAWGVPVDVSAEALAALCRAWLAVDAAPVACAGKSAVMGEGWQIYGLDGDNIASLPFEDGKRVRIVPVEGEGDAT